LDYYSSAKIVILPKRLRGTRVKERTAQVLLEVNGEPDSGIEELAESIAQLYAGLIELDVSHIDTVRIGEPPPGAKAGEGLVLGALVVSLVRSAGGLTAVVRMAQDWLRGHSHRSIKLDLDGDVLEVTGLSSDDQRRLISSWIERHAER
jgi:hypothetical protein